MKTSDTGYMVVIQSSPEKEFQPYVGWDEVFATKKLAADCAKRAEAAGHMATKVVKVELTDVFSKND